MQQINALTKQRNDLIRTARASKNPQAGQQIFSQVSSIMAQRKILIGQLKEFWAQPKNKGARCFGAAPLPKTCWTINKNTYAITPSSDPTCRGS